MARYKDAIAWIAREDDTDWIEEGAGLSVTASMVADLFGKPDEQVEADIKEALRKERALRSGRRMHSIGA